MKASARHEQGKRRGIILVLILGVLALMAVIGVTFATFSVQSRISARNAAQAIIVPQRDELFDYALSQLVCDTPDIRSAIRGHSLARDMYGDDAYFNGYLATRPGGANPPNYNYSTFYITSVSAPLGSSNSTGGTFYDLTSNIIQGDPAIYGYDFTRWILRISYAPAPTAPGTYVVNQTLEVLPVTGRTNGYVAGSTANLVFRVNINSVAPYATDSAATLINPSGSGYVTQLPGNYLVAGGFGLTDFPFVLDGRWLHAFNGPGMTTNAVHANFRFNGSFQGLPTSDGEPNLVGMDEDYDAADLENWFLAMQSADGSVMIPSFHRPAAIRVDTANTTNDWSRTTGWTYDLSRILRPVAADGHDAATFPDLLPNSNGLITYDVDNDGDGQSDSVWLDLGYPARRNAQGILYKPLFAFMVIGLNGRIPLNTAGNLAGSISGVGGGPTHAAHLGNSVSEIDPTYGLQNGYVFNTDAAGAYTAQSYGGPYGPPTGPNNTQVDNAGTDVRLTQLRNLLAGTRPQVNPGVPGVTAGVRDTTGLVNGDNNFVLINGVPYFMPNGIADTVVTSIDVDGTGVSPPTSAGVLRVTTPVAGRWGEAQAIPGYPVVANPSPPPAYFNLVTANYNDLVRAGFSLDPSDYNNGTPRDAADDNYNSFDPFPPGHTGEFGDLDFLDPAGAFLLPVERMRRYVAPTDINGAGRIVSYDGVNPQAGLDLGSDQWGRVEYSNYFRPPGLPGQVTPGAGTTAVTFLTISGSYPTTLVTNVTTGALAGNLLLDSNPLHGFEAQRYPNLTYPAPSVPPAFSPQRVGGAPIDLPAVTPPWPILPTTVPTLPTYSVSVNGNVNSGGLDEADEMNLYQPNAQLDSPFGYSDLEWLCRLQDVDGNALNSRLAQLAPISFTNVVDGQRRRRLYSIDSWDLNDYAWTNDNPGNVFPNNCSFSPSFTGALTAGSNIVGVTGITNIAALLPGQTVVGTGPDIPPDIPPGTTIVTVSPTSTTTGTITLTAPANVTKSDQLNVLGQNASFGQLGINQYQSLPTPSLAHRDRRINLNYPLPVSNDPNEPVRQKWITDTYNMLKAILPPKAVDTAEELAQLSQFVINIIDYRDPDATMTHWRNPDILFRPSATSTTSPIVVLAPGNPTDIPVDQYGMEYNPIAINEVLGYSFQGSSSQISKLFIELVNTLTSPELGTPTTSGLGNGSNNASVLDLAGFQSGGTPAPTTPWDGGCWDLVFTDDLPQSRPDPISGQLQPGGHFFGLIPLSSTAAVGAIKLPPYPPATGVSTPAPTGDPVLFPLPQAMPPGGIATLTNLFIGYFSTTGAYQPLAPYYFTTIGSPPTSDESSPYTPTYQLNTAWDPFMGGTPTGALPAGVLPPATYGGTAPSSYPPNPAVSSGTPSSLLPGVTPGSGKGAMVWICLRRPANPFAGVSANNPMIVVDAMRFPFIEAGANPTTPGNYIFSYQRLQPFRGGHAVPVPGASGALDTRYGYSEQVAVPVTMSSTWGLNGGNQITGPAANKGYYHTLGGPNDVNPSVTYPFTPPATSAADLGSAGPPVRPPTLSEPWDYFPFNDRDFTSVAELLLVPGCPPGLFTKQFAEFAPSQANVTSVFGAVTPISSTLPAGSAFIAPPVAPTTASNPFYGTTVPPTTPLQPHTFPYLIDKFFYSAYGGPVPPATAPPADPGAMVDGYGSDGWFKMFEFFEVPSQMIGAIGPVAQGTDFDWLRQDLKPGLININLVIDEEVFFSVFGAQDQNFNQQLLCFDQLPNLSLSFNGASWGYAGTASTLPLAALTSPIPLVVTSTLANGSPGSAYPMNNVGVLATDPISSTLLSGIKASFAQFLSVRHGGSGFVFGYGSGAVGQNFAYNTSPPNPNNTAPTGIPADRSFHSLSYPDINYTVMRPAALPPWSSPPTWPPPPISTDPPPATPTSTALPPTYTGTAAGTGVYTGDPGVRNYILYPALATGANPASSTTAILLPPAIPVRRLFQPPDVSPAPPAQSNAGELGDLYLNNLKPVTAPSTAGALPPYNYPPPPAAGTTYTVSASVAGQPGVVNLFWAGVPSGGSLPNPYLGANSVAASLGPPPVSPQFDYKQHPYFRTEMLQKVMNLTTVRTHQFAVWITIGFFEVKREGDLLMIQQGNPVLAFDILGPELGAATGQTARYRGFFIVDRLKLYGFNDQTPGSFRPAVVYRQMIE
ncbi:MAG: hypothetical protein ACLP7Q_06170 [Isosphaeraceae bacterium]